MVPRKFRFAVNALLPLAWVLIFRPVFLLPDLRAAVFSCVHLLVFCLLAAEGLRQLIALHQMRYSGNRFLAKRLTRILLEGFVFINVLGLVLQYLADRLGVYPQTPTLLTYLQMTVHHLFLLLFLVAVYEGYYLWSDARAGEKKVTELSRLQLANQFSQLKDQLSPHFLFNSLTTLSSLIDINPAKAQEFLEELSLVYRYLLTYNGKRLVPLEEEMKMLESYSNLIGTRFSDSVRLDVNIRKEFLAYYIPPLTLQLLVENAVKHNAFSRTMPLVISIESDHSARLHVRNRKQKKTVDRSTGKGLKNIREKFKLLNSRPVEVLNDNEEFTVIVPLVNQYIHELSHEI